jgi:hypothetical protein
MLRTFKQFTVTAAGTPQPLVGTKLNAALAAGSMLTATVLDSSMFINNDWAILMETNGTLRERVAIASIPDATHVVIRNVVNAHASGAWLQLAGGCADVNVMAVGVGAGGTFFYLGTDFNMNKTGLVKCVSKILVVAAAIQPTIYTTANSGQVNVDDMSNFWIDADNNTDNYLPSFDIV